VDRVLRPAAVALALAGCLEYSPHAPPTAPEHRDVHAKALARLAEAPAPSPLRFAVVGDTQRAFDAVEDAVAFLNARDDLAFVVQMGDFTHYGIAPEFVQMNDLFLRLRAPYFVVIGAHEHLGNGRDIYARMFGERELAFTHGRTRFLLFDSNSRELGFRGDVPDLAWLAAQLPGDGTYDLAVFFSHVLPGSSDFDPALEEPYLALLRGAGRVLSFHAHEHRFDFEERDGVPLYLADAVDHRSILVVTVHESGAFEVERVHF
jgi:hypothetical protein